MNLEESDVKYDSLEEKDCPDKKVSKSLTDFPFFHSMKNPLFIGVFFPDVRNEIFSFPRAHKCVMGNKKQIEPGAFDPNDRYNYWNSPREYIFYEISKSTHIYILINLDFIGAYESWAKISKSRCGQGQACFTLWLHGHLVFSIELITFSSFSTRSIQIYE